MWNVVTVCCIVVGKIGDTVVRFVLTQCVAVSLQGESGARGCHPHRRPPRQEGMGGLVLPLPASSPLRREVPPLIAVPFSPRLGAARASRRPSPMTVQRPSSRVSTRRCSRGVTLGTNLGVKRNGKRVRCFGHRFPFLFQ